MPLLTAAAAAVAAMAVASPTAGPPCPMVVIHERFEPAAEARGHRGAVTYDPELVPTTARVYLVEKRVDDGDKGRDMDRDMDRDRDRGSERDNREDWDSDHHMKRGTFVALALRGAAPDHRFGIHVHTEPCGTKPGSSGPHYQHNKDPKQPSTNPKYANPRNELWLDLTTNGRGNGFAKAAVKWHFRPGEARSVVVHEHATATRSGAAGEAGDRVACVNVPFK